MDKSTKYRLINLLTVIYCAVALIEITAEYFNNREIMWLSKPLLMPLLIAAYIISSQRINYIFILALGCSWISNMFFISGKAEDIVLGGCIFLGYRLLVMLMVLKLVKLPSMLPMVLGSLPFIFIYLYVICDSYAALGEEIYLFAAQGLFISLLGGFSVGSYIMSPNKANTLLLISTMMFAATQFIFMIRLFYVSLGILQSAAMGLYVIGQFILCRFVLIAQCEEYDSEFLEKPISITSQHGEPG